MVTIDNDGEDMSLERIADDICLDFPQPLESSVLRSVVRAFREFCVSSEAWRMTLEECIVKGVNHYDICMPEGAYILALNEARFSGSEGTDYKLTPVDLNAMELSETGNPHHCFISDTQFIVAEAGGTGLARVEVKVAPTVDIKEIPKVIGNKYFDVIRSGAIHDLLKTPGQEWRPDMTRNEIDQYRMYFLEGIATAKREANRSMSKPKRTVKYGGISFGRRRNQASY